MLNRRFLRIKAMQGVFAYNQREKANVSRALDCIDEFFAPDLNSMEKPDYKQLNKDKNRAKKVFEESYQTQTIESAESDEVTDAVTSAIDYYTRENAKDILDVKQQLIKDLDHVIHWVFSTLQFVVEIADHLESHLQRKSIQVATEYNICNNAIVKKLKSSEQYKAMLSRYDVAWDREDSLAWRFYREVLSKDERYKDYLSIQNPTFEQDREFFIALVKKILFKNDIFLSHIEDNDPHWVENEEISRSIILKNLKAISEDEPIQFITYPENWNEDKAFYELLFKEAVQKNEQIDKAIEDKLKNWEADRLASTDMVIIKMAIIEMINFHSIPIKVTMNEFIELAKKYSTPKSKMFINGVLDTISKDFIASGIIKKSGRGLLDNK